MPARRAAGSKSTPLATFLTVMVIAISLTLPRLLHGLQNVSSAASQYYPSPQITVYLEKTLDDDAAARWWPAAGGAGRRQGKHLSRDEALGNSVTGLALAAPGYAGGEPAAGGRHRGAEAGFPEHRGAEYPARSGNADPGVDEVRMDDSWFAVSSLTGLVGRVSAMIGVLMVAAVFPVIGNSVRLSIFARRDTINVQKLIGATDGFILRPFLTAERCWAFPARFYR